MIQGRPKNLCQKGGSHQGKQIIMVCLNAQCDNKRICCLVCIDEYHRKHELISLRKFDSKLQILKIQTNPEIKEAILKRIQLFQQKSMHKFDRIAQDFSKNIQRCKQKFKQILALTYTSLNLNFTQNFFEQLYNNFTSPQICKYLELVNKAESQSFKDIQGSDKLLSTANNMLQKQMKDFQKVHQKQLQELNKGIDKLKLVLSQDGSKFKRLFSKINKAVSITVSDEQDIAHRAQGSGGYPIVVMEQALTETNDNANVRIKQQPGNKGCWLGVCVLDIVKTFNFASCYGIGKGTWAIDQVGASHMSSYSWSHHDSNFNSQPKVGWQFATGDVINVRVDFQKSTVIFTRGTDIYEQPIKLDLGDIYVFVGCTHLGDMWAIE